MKKLLIVVVLLALVIGFLVPRVDSYRESGELTAPSLQAEVRVLRDDNGVPYVYADSLDDALVAQGYLHAQERLFQLELQRYLAHGRLAEFVGERGLVNDRLMRLLDISGFARRQEARLSAAERNYLQRYLDGVNDYIATRGEEFPLMLGVMDHQVQPWTLADVLAIQYFRVWSSSVNWRQELLTLKLIDHLGPGRAASLHPITINPDEPGTDPRLVTAGDNFGDNFGDSLLNSNDAGPELSGPDELSKLSPKLSKLSPDLWAPRYAMGSDAWASDGGKSAGGRPILSSDPHLDARHLPGFWYPMGIITPEVRAVGGATPGGPGIGVGRNAYIAWGATNGYADMVDLFIETADPDKPDHYLEGDRSLPFVTRREEVRILDREAEGGYRSEWLEIRSTRRGPLVSDLDPDAAGGRLLSLRWSVPEYAGPDAGNRELLQAHSVTEALAAIGKMVTPLNHVVIDVEGNIARLASGVVPIRRDGDGLVPLPAGDTDNWLGPIPAADMPLQLNPARGWVGSANHRVTGPDYPYAFSTHFSGSWRYRRIMELMDRDQLSAADHWAANQDIKNLLARRMRPAMLAAFEQDPALAPLARILADWNLEDDKDLSAPLIFQSFLRHFAWETFVDELGDELAMAYLKEPYYWQERLLYWYERGHSEWFDDSRTDEVDGLGDIILRAGRLARQELVADWGEDPDAWRWGDAHTVTFYHPFIPGADAARWIGGGVHPMSGSGETLNRGVWMFDAPYEARIIDSLRVIVDLADEDRVMAHFPGGNSERWFDSGNKTFLDAWLTGDTSYWWFSDRAIAENARTELKLKPGAA